MISTLKNLLERATQVRAEVKDLANTAFRIGQLLIDIIKRGVAEYDPNSPYDKDQYVIFDGVLAKATDNTLPGENPNTAPLKWSVKLVTNPDQATVTNKLPISASAVRILIDQVKANNGIPNASTTTRGAARQASDKEAAQGVNNDSFTTPKHLNDRFNKFYTDYADIAIDKFGEVSTDKAKTDFLKWLLEAAKDDEDVQKLMCGYYAKCGDTGSKPVTDFEVVGASTIAEPTSGSVKEQYRAYATYSDGSHGYLTQGLVVSIIKSSTESIDQTGLLTVPRDSIANNNRQVTIRMGYRLPGQTEDTVRQKVVNITDGSTSSQTLTSAGVVKYYELISTNQPFPDGSLEAVKCGLVTGWLKDRNNPNASSKQALFINDVFADFVTGSIYRPDVDPYLKDTGNTTGMKYGFEYVIPEKFRKAGKLKAELRTLDGKSIFRNSPKESNDVCIDLSSLLNVSQDKPVSSNVGTEPGWPIAYLTDDKPTTVWSTGCITASSPVTVTIDLEGTAQPPQIKILPRQGDPAAMPVSYFIDGSLDGNTWFRLVTVNNQPRGEAETILDVEKDLNGNFQTVRYVRMTTTSNGAAVDDCNRVQLAGFKVMAPSLTPIDSPPPTKKPKSLHIFGDGALREGTHIQADVHLFYDNGDSEVVTNVSTRDTGNDFALTWNDTGDLFAANNGTVGDSRSATLTARYAGLVATKVINIYDTTVPVFVKSQRIDRVDGNSADIKEGTSANYKITNIKNDNTEDQYTGGGTYRSEEPYPNGMTITTGANATGTVTLPDNSITGSFPRQLYFDLPNGGTIETTMNLVNVDNAQPANTIQSVAYRFVKGGSVAGQPTDLIEVAMRDTYAETPMAIQLWLSSSAIPKDGYKGFQRVYDDGSVANDGQRHAYWDEIGVLANKSFKVGITTLANGNAGNPNLLTFSITTTSTSTNGFVQVYPV